MKTFRVNILGCRSRGTSAAQAYHAHPRCEVVGLCVLMAERRDTLGDALGVADRFEDLDEMIRETQPDIVAIPTGTEFHYDLIMRVLDYGVNIDVEKPICVDLVQADEVIAKAEEKGAQIAVHHQGRSGACLAAVDRAYRAGKIGDLRHINASGKGYYGGYGLMNIGTHAINAMLELTGPCRRVFANVCTNGKPISPQDVLPSPSGMGTIAGEDITAILDFDDRVVATLTQHRFPEVDSTAMGFEILGTEGRLFWRNTRAWSMSQPHFNPERVDGVWEPLDLLYPDHYDPAGKAAADEYLYVEEYVNALDEGRPHISSGHQGRHVMEVMMAIFESGSYGKAIDLPQTDRSHPLLRWCGENGVDELPEMPRAYGEWLAAEGTRLGWSDNDRDYKVKRI